MNLERCRFCLDNALLADDPIFITDKFFVLASNDPALPNATMVIPRRHSATPFEMTPEEWADLPNALAGAREALAKLTPDGFTLGWNVGEVAGQTVQHTHLHVIARFQDDPMAGKGIRHALKRLPEDGKA